MSPRSCLLKGTTVLSIKDRKINALGAVTMAKREFKQRQSATATPRRFVFIFTHARARQRRFL
jgi:hypothetical protein